MNHQHQSLWDWALIPFASLSERDAAMRDPRYKNQWSEYHAAVELKIKATQHTTTSTETKT